MKQEYDLEIKRPKLRAIMHQELGMSYRRIEATPWQGNSPKNLILRQHFAINFLKLDLSKKTIINIDETWLGMTDFRRRKWQFPGFANSVAQL